MDIHWKQGSTKLTYDGKEIECSCHVRNEINKERLPSEVIYTIPNEKPYMPRIFPVGTWMVSRPVPRHTKDRAPFYVPTSAFQMVPVWNVEKGLYKNPTNETDKDEGYGIHFSEFNSTLGCIRIVHKTDLMVLVEDIRAALDTKEKVRLIVE